jgi:hypothetical protein
MESPAGPERRAALDTSPPAVPLREPSLSQLVGQLTDDARDLVRQELAIARTEATQTAKTLAVSGAFVATGATLLLVGVVVLTVFLVIGLGELLGDRFWLSSLIIGSLFALAGVLALLRGRRGLRSDALKPAATIDTLQQTREWASREAAELKHDLKS